MCRCCSLCSSPFWWFIFLISHTGRFYHFDTAVQPSVEIAVENVKGRGKRFFIKNVYSRKRAFLDGGRPRGSRSTASSRSDVFTARAPATDGGPSPGARQKLEKWLKGFSSAQAPSAPSSSAPLTPTRTSRHATTSAGSTSTSRETRDLISLDGQPIVVDVFQNSEGETLAVVNTHWKSWTEGRGEDFEDKLLWTLRSVETGKLVQAKFVSIHTFGLAGIVNFGKGFEVGDRLQLTVQDLRRTKSDGGTSDKTSTSSPPPANINYHYAAPRLPTGTPRSFQLPSGRFELPPSILHGRKFFLAAATVIARPQLTDGYSLNRWISYHRSIGVEHFLIYINDPLGLHLPFIESLRRQYSTLKRSVSDEFGMVTFLPSYFANHWFPFSDQGALNMHALYTFKGVAKWWLSCDVDEFVFSRVPLKSFLRGGEDGKGGDAPTTTSGLDPDTRRSTPHTHNKPDPHAYQLGAFPVSKHGKLSPVPLYGSRFKGKVILNSETALALAVHMVSDAVGGNKTYSDMIIGNHEHVSPDVAVLAHFVNQTEGVDLVGNLERAAREYGAVEASNAKVGVKIGGRVGEVAGGEVGGFASGSNRNAKG